MKFFLFSLFLLLLFDRPQGSTPPSKRHLGELNTTLKTNVDGTCQRMNPCTKKEIQSTSFVGSQEFSHHVSGENWSDYSQKCSAIIKSFLQAIGNLVRFDSNPNGTFNFHINTSITHKEDGHCNSKKSQSRCLIPTIIIEATGCEVPPPSCNSPAEKDKNTQINTSKHSTKGQQNFGELITRKPNLTSQGENTSSYRDSKTSQDVTEIIEIPAQDRTPKFQAGRFEGKKSWTPENVTPIGTVQTVLPLVQQCSTMETTTTEASTETFTEISKLEQNSDMYGPPHTPTQPSSNYVTDSLTLLPEDKFTSPAPPPPDTFDLGNPSGFAPNIPKIPERIPQTTVEYKDQFIPNQPIPFGMDQPQNDNSRQLFNDKLGGQALVYQQSVNSFPSPDQIPMPNLPSTNAFRDETQLERPFAYPVATSLGEPQRVELPFSKPSVLPRAPAAGPPATNYPKHFPNQLRTTTPFPPTIVTPEFDELPGQGLVTRPPLTENDFFNGPGKPFPHDQRPELPTPLPPTRTPVFNTDYDANEDSQGLTKQTLPINQPVHIDNVAFAPKYSSKFSVINNRNQPNRPRVFHDNQLTSRIPQPHQQFATETADMNRFSTNILPKPAFGPKFRERPGLSYPLNPSEHLETPPPQFTASPQTPPEPFPQPTANLDIPQPQPTLPYEDKPLTTPAPELRSSVEETNNRDAITPHSDYINPRIPPFTLQEFQLQPPRTTIAAPELTSSFDYDYQYPNYDDVQYDYPVQKSPNSTFEHLQNPRGFVYRQFYPRARGAPFRRVPPNFFPRQYPMRNPHAQNHPHIRNYNNNLKFINTTMPEYQPEYDYQNMDGVAPEQAPDYDYADYPQFEIKAPVLTTTAYENETLTTEFPTTAEPEYQTPLEPVHQTTEGIQQVLHHREEQAPNFSKPDLQLGGKINQTFPPKQPPMRNFEAQLPQPVARKFENETISTDFQTITGPNHQPSVELNNQNIRGRWIGQMPNSYNPGQRIPNGFFQPGQPFRGGAPFHRIFPAHQQSIRNFRPLFTPETPKNKSEFQSTEISEFDNQFINHRNSGQISNSHFAGKVPNTFNQPQPQLRGNAFPVHSVNWAFPSGEHPPRNLEIGQPGPNPHALENESRVTMKPEFQPQEDNQNTKDRGAEKIPESHFTEGHVQNTVQQAESTAKGNKPIFPVEQQQNFAVNQPDFSTYENETATTEFQTTVRPEYQPPAELINQHTDGKHILPPPVSDFRGHQTQNLGQSKLRDNRRPGQIFPLKQQHMNFEVPQSRHSSEEKTISRDFQKANEHRLQPLVEHDSRHIGNKWTGQRPNFQFRGHQLPNTFPQPGQQFIGGTPLPPPLSVEPQPQRILEDAQPQFIITAYEDATSAAPEHQSSLEPQQSASIEQQTQEIQNLGPESDSQLTKSPPGELPSASSSKQDQEGNFQISQPRSYSGGTYEEGTFTTAPQPSHENVNDRAVSDFAEQQNQNNFDQSRLNGNAPSRQFPPNTSPHQSMETSKILHPNPPAQPTQEFQAPAEHHRGMPNFPVRNPQNPRPFLQPHFHPNFFPQQQSMRNTQMGPPRRIQKNETVMTEFQETKPETQNYENDFTNDRRPDLPNHHFTNQKNPNAFGRPESQVHAHFRRFPSEMRQVDRHDGPPFVKRPPMEFSPSRGLGRIPESMPGPFSDTRIANRFVNPPNKNQPTTNRNNFQPETALMHSDRNLDYDIPTSFHNSRPTPNEYQPEPQTDLIPGVRTSDEYLSATSSDETNTTSPPNTSVDYEDEENIPSVVSPYPGQVLNDNVTTPKRNTSALYSEQITPIISSPRWQPPADISTSEYKNSLYSQPPLSRPKPLEVISTSESTKQAFGGDQPPVIPVREEFPSDFNANPVWNPAHVEDTADIHEKQIERNSPISVPQKFSSKTLSPAAPFIPSNQLPPAIENPITNQPQPLAFGPPNYPTPLSQPIVPIYQQQHSQPQNPYHTQRRPERNFNSDEQQLSGIPPLNRHSESSTQSATRTMAFTPQSQPQDVPLTQPNGQNFNSVNSFVTLPPVNQHSNAIRLNQQSPIQSNSDSATPQADLFIQAGSEVESQSVISANDQQSPGDFNLQKTPFKLIPAASPQLPQPTAVVKTTPKTSNQQQFHSHQRTSKFPQTASPKLTNATYEEVTTTTDYPQPFSGIPVQLFKSPVNAPTRFQDTPRQVGNPDFVHSELLSPVTEATSSQVLPPYVDEINPTSQTDFESQYVHDKISTNSPPPVAEPQPQLSFAYTTIQNYRTTERPVLRLKPKTLAIPGPQNQEDFTNAENSNRQQQENLNIPPPKPPHPDQHYAAATSLNTSETAYEPIASLHEKHDKQPAQHSLEFIDNSPQSQPTTAVKYPEKTQTTEYEPSHIFRPQPQTALNNSGRQTEDNSANVWADQQQQITSSPEFGVTPPMTYDRVPPKNHKNIDTHSRLPSQHISIDSQNHYIGPQTHKSKTTETYEEIIATDNPHRQTPQPVFVLGDRVSPRRNPFYNRFTARPPQSIRNETALNPNQQISAATVGGHATPQITDSLVLPLKQEHPSNKTREEVIVVQKTTAAPPPKQSVTKIPDTLTSVEHKSVTSVRNTPTKTKIVEEIVTTELPKNIVTSPASTQLAFAEKLLNYESKKLSKLQKVTTPSPVVENNHSSTPPAGSSSYSEQIPNRQIVLGGNAFPKNFERDNEQFEGSSPPNHVFTSTPQRPQQVILDNPTSSFDDYDQQHFTRSPDMFPEYDEIPPNFNSRTSLTKGQPIEKSHLTFPMQPSAALSVNSRWTTPIPNDSLSSKPRNAVQQSTQVTTATPQPGFLPSVSTPSNSQDHPTTERFTSFSRPDGPLVRSV